MKANDFVRKFGWEKAKEFSQIIIKGLCKKFDFEINTGESIELAYVDLNDLKRLVESWELVERFGGLSDAREVVKMGRYYKYLKRAIADVESCL